MIGKLKNITNTEEKKRLLENFFSLSILQGANYILPFITLPYLVRILGPEKFGLIAFAQSFIQYFNILTDYGFNLSATREISIHRENKEKVSEIFSSVMIIKFGLLFLSFIIMTFVVFSFSKFRKDWPIYYLSFGMVIGQVLFPVWFFQGMEKMKYVTILYLIAKIIFTFSVFIFVNKVSDYIFVPLLNSLGFLVTGVIALFIVFKYFKIKPFLVSHENLFLVLKRDFYIFLSRLKISLFSNSNIFILGIIAGNKAAGYFSAAEKLMRAIASLQIPLVNSLFPYMSRKMRANQKKAFEEIKLILKLGTTIYFSLCLLVYFYHKDIVVFIYGKNMLNSALVLQILAIVPLMIFLNNLFGTQILLSLGKDKQFFYVLFIAGIINLFMVSVLSFYFTYIGAAISSLIVESFVCLGMYFYARKEGFYILRITLFKITLTI